MRADEKRIDWSALHYRLESSRAALARSLTPGSDEKRKILRERAQKLAAVAKTDAEGAAVLEVVEFVLEGESYGITAEHIQEIHPLHDFTPLPGAPRFVLGLVNVRGQVLPIISLKRFFGMREKGLSDLNKVMVVRTGEAEAGVLADRIVGARTVAVAELSRPMTSEAMGGHQLGTTKDFLTVLDVAKMFGEGAFSTG